MGRRDGSFRQKEGGQANNLASGSLGRMGVDFVGMTAFLHTARLFKESRLPGSLGVIQVQGCQVARFRV